MSPAVILVAFLIVIFQACDFSGASDADIAVSIGAGAEPTPRLGANVEATVLARFIEEPVYRGTIGTLATVVRVVDGDTIDVAFGGGRTDTIRLLAVDTPETFSANKPYEYGSITDTACLDEWGTLATAYARHVLDGQTVEVEMDWRAGDRGSFDRLLAYIRLNQQDFNASLVELGYARVYTEGTASREEEYVVLEKQARARELGLWGCESGALETPVDTAIGDCDPAYPDVCIPSPPPDLDCGEIPFRRFTVLPPDPHRFDGDKDGVGCER